MLMGTTQNHHHLSVQLKTICASVHKDPPPLWRVSKTQLCTHRVGQNHRKQVLRISCIKFHLLTFQFVVISHGKRDLSSLPEAGEAAVQISWKKEAVGQLMRSCQGNSIFRVRFSKPAIRGFVQPCRLPNLRDRSGEFVFANGLCLT